MAPINVNIPQSGNIGLSNANINLPASYSTPVNSQTIAPLGPAQKTPQASAISTPAVTSSPHYAPVNPAPTVDATGGVKLNAGGLPIVDNSKNFTIDTSGLTTDHMAGDNTPSSVLGALGMYQNNYNSYLKDISPYQVALADATQFSPDYINAMNKSLDTNQGLRAGVQNIRSRPEALDFQQGQEAALTRDTALQQTANAENMNLQEAIRQNNIDALNAVIKSKQDNYQNQFGATKAGMDFGISAGQLGVQQQQVNQDKYDFQSVMSQTGFPVIQVIDKATGQPLTTVDPNSPQGQAIVQSGHLINGTGNLTGGSTSDVVAQTLKMIGQGVDGSVPLSQALSTYGTQPIVNAIVQQEGGSPQGVYNNPGNIKFVGTPGQVDSGVKAADGGTFASYSTPQAGLQAVADIVNHAASGSSAAYGKNPSLSDFIGTYKGVSAQGNSVNSPHQFSYDEIQAAAQSLNPSSGIANAIKPLPDGGAYIDVSQLADPKFTSIANIFAQRAGIKVLNPQYASTVQTITQSIDNLNQLTQSFADLAPTSVAGKFGNTATNFLSTTFDTDYGSKLKAFASNRESLFQQIRSLAGSSPRVTQPELNSAANAMPVLTGWNKDTLKDGVNKLVKTQSYLDNAIRALVPDYVGSPTTINGTSYVLLSDGQAHGYPDPSTAMKALQLDMANK